MWLCRSCDKYSKKNDIESGLFLVFFFRLDDGVPIVMKVVTVIAIDDFAVDDVLFVFRGLR